MTDNYFFDTDCISSFLWVKNECLLVKLYSRVIVIPNQVYEEIKKIPHLFARIEALKTSGVLRVESIIQDTEEAELYNQMLVGTETILPIGRGEAACIAMVKERGGVLASNNLKDINEYVSMYKIRHITTGDILKEALTKGLITLDDGESLWANMLAKKRKLGYLTFAEFLKDNS